MRRSYVQLQKSLHPDSVFFLGDLFDGGREWATMRDDTDDPQWQMNQRPKAEKKLLGYWKKHYGEDFWLWEYFRFGDIFLRHWNDGGRKAEKGQRGRKIIASLPGNHDLGFGANIKLPVRDRFEAYFGEPNRVDIIGNHSIVSIDSVSLSANTDKSQIDNVDVYGPVEKFLDEVQSIKRRALARELRFLNHLPTELQQSHKVTDLESTDFSHLPTLDPGENSTASLPSILLTHVPLYRDPGTPCGPLRERYPPTPPPAGQITPVTPDERNAISVARGYQYQNVLSDTDSIHVVESIGDVQAVFSGDDHDYCEIVHPANKNNAREITVKSTSYAMGVRKPGFLLVSLWNPIDGIGMSIGTLGGGHGSASHSSTTIETHLCLLPDQIGILLRYVMLIVLTLVALLVRAILTPLLGLPPSLPPLFGVAGKTAPLLPLTKEKEPPNHRMSNSSTSSTSSTASATLAPRTTTARTRSVSPAGGYGLPAEQSRSAVPMGSWEAEDLESRRSGNWYSNGYIKDKEWSRERGRIEGGVGRYVAREFAKSVWRVAWVVMVWFLFLARYG
jgi:hypothetical protein